MAGNIRELKNVIRRAVLIADTEFINPGHIKFLEHPESDRKRESLSHNPDASPTLNLREVETMAIKKALDITKGNKTKAAALLNISYVTLLKKIKEYSDI